MGFVFESHMSMGHEADGKKYKIFKENPC